MRHALSALGLAAAFSFIATAAHAADVSLGLSNKAISVDATSPPIGQGLEITGGWLHHSDNGDASNVGLQVSQKISEGLEASLGGKFVFVNHDIRNVWALALGGGVEWALPPLPSLRLGVHAWYSPNVTTFHRAENLYDIGTSVSYRVLPNGEVFAAWRRIRVDFEGVGHRSVQSGPLFGMKLMF